MRARVDRRALRDLHPETDQRRRHHLHETAVQDAVRGAFQLPVDWSENMQLIRTMKPKAWLTVAKALLALMPVVLFMADGVRQLVVLAGIFVLVGICFGCAFYSHSAAQQGRAAGERRSGACG